VLDNAPTYLAFAASAAGLEGVPAHGPYIGALAIDPEAARILAAIATGSGVHGREHLHRNAPNFMVKAIAEESGIRCHPLRLYGPTAAGILLPIFVAIAFLFFR